MAAAYEPAREVGGDFFDAFPIPARPGTLSLVIGDVTGKGIAAALMMAFSRAVLRSAGYNGTGPADALRRANRVLTGDVHTGLFLTAIVVELDEGSGGCGGRAPATSRRSCSAPAGAPSASSRRPDRCWACSIGWRCATAP